MSATPDSRGDMREVWLLNRPASLAVDDLDDWLAQGTWESPDPGKHASKLADMAPGDRVALKTTSTRTHGVAFFNADRGVSVMRIHARGTVTSVDALAGQVKIAWDDFEPRDWYFWTFVVGFVKVTDQDSSGREFLDFLFNDKPQDLSKRLSHPYWRDRYPAQTSFSWTPFYEAFATRLLDFQDDRRPLVEAFHRVAAREPLLSYLATDHFPDGSIGPTSDLDPFTLMGTFNRNVTIENRRRILRALADELDVEPELPADFYGIPVLNNQNSWFLKYAEGRDEGDIDRLWKVFAAGLAFTDENTPSTRETFVAAFDEALTVKNVHWNLTLGLYWARPAHFATLDTQSRPYIKRQSGLSVEPLNAQSYLDTLAALRQWFASDKTSIGSFQQLSYAAWFDGIRVAQEHSMGGFAYWAARFAETADLEAEEDEYKRRTAEHMSDARRKAAAGDPEWVTAFKDALTASYNLLHYMFKSNVVKAVSADPNHWAEVFNGVWEAAAPSGLNDLAGALRSELDKATPGNITALGALLLLGTDVEENAPYLTSRTNRWYDLAGFPGPSDTNSPSERYATLLAFLDQLRAEMAAQSGRSVTRLEAQGCAWAVTEFPVPDEWDPASSRSLQQFRGADSSPTRSWLLAADDASSTEQWLSHSYVSLGTPSAQELVAADEQADVLEALQTAQPESDPDDLRTAAAEILRFLRHMSPDDLVCTLAGGRLHIGTVTGDVSAGTGPGVSELRREVDWLGDLEADSEPLRDVRPLLDVPGRLRELPVPSDLLRALVSEEPDEENPPAPPEPARDPSLPTVGTALARATSMGEQDLQEMVDLLAARKQIVFYGPPGTGKTYLSMALAKHIVGPDNPSRAQLVQFHPSYAYEDFFEGYRPTEQGGFRLERGPLRRLAAEADKHAGEPFVLVIDEMNRANIAKVFGELYFLLEYRRQSMQLQYSPADKPFRLPENLYLIGTMNTADRSVALLDAAMRRRFAFVELHPDVPPVRDVLPTFLETRAKQDGRGALLSRLNALIEEQDRDFKIGPSYLMKPEADTAEGLERIWRYDLLPLLEEHYYGRLTRTQVHERFALDRLRPAPTDS